MIGGGGEGNVKKPVGWKASHGQKALKVNGTSGGAAQETFVLNPVLSDRGGGGERKEPIGEHSKNL